MGIGTKIVDFLAGGFVDKAMGVVDKLVVDKDLKVQLKAALEKQLALQGHERDIAAIEAEKEIELAIQATHQTDLNQADLYTKRTRPKIARQSWYLTMFYGAYTIVAPAFPEVPQIGFMWEMFVAMASPALTYMGVRSFDKWKVPTR